MNNLRPTLAASLVLAVMTSIPRAQELEVQWAITLPSERSPIQRLVATPDGHAFFQGTLKGPVSWGTLESKSTGSVGYFARLEANGALQWIRQKGAPTRWWKSLPDNQLLAVGDARSPQTCFGIYTVDTNGDPVGTVAAAPTKVTGPHVRAIRRLANGDYVLAGSVAPKSFAQTLFGETLTSRKNSADHPFVVRLDASGKPRWLLTGYSIPDRHQSLGNFVVRGAGVDASGRVTLLADVSGVQAFVGEKRVVDTYDPSSGRFSNLLIQVDPDGNVEWIQHPARPVDDSTDALMAGDVTLSQLFVADHGASFVAGTAKGRSMIGPQRFTGPVEHRSWVESVVAASFDTTGKLRWLEQLSSSGLTRLRNATCDDQGNMTVAIEFLDRAVIAGQPFQSRGQEDVVILSLTPRGELRGMLHFGGPERDQVHHMAVGAGGDVWFAGMKGANTAVGNRAVQGRTFLARLGVNGN